MGQPNGLRSCHSTPFLVAFSLTVVACTTASPATRTAPAATTSPIAATTKPETIAPTMHGDTLGSDASISYDGFRAWAGQSMGVAIVRILDIGPVRWNSVSGERPPEANLQTAPRGHRDSYNLGRLVTAEPVRLVSGLWPASSAPLRYWRPGGSVAADSFEPPFEMPDLEVGAEAVALLNDADAGADGPIPIQIGWLFPVDGTGRLVTPDPSESITLARLGSFLP